MYHIICSTSFEIFWSPSEQFIGTNRTQIFKSQSSLQNQDPFYQQQGERGPIT